MKMPARSPSLNRVFAYHRSFRKQPLMRSPDKRENPMMPKEFDVTGKVVFITGAGRGIGKGIAQVLARRGPMSRSTR